MFHKFWVGETKEERRRRLKEEEAAAAAYPEWKRQQDELYEIQNKLIFMTVRFFIMFYQVLFKILKAVAVFIWPYVKKQPAYDARKLPHWLRKKE